MVTRSVPKLRTLSRSLVIALLCALAFQFLFPTVGLCADGGTFDCFYSAAKGIGWGWLIVIVFAIGAGTITWFSGGTAAPWMVSIGGWIGSWAGLSGAAATNFGLALLGGGSIAAGGLGVAGGVAVLTAAATFGTGLAVEYSIDYAIKEYSDAQFIEDSKRMMNLPLPINKDGSARYRIVVNYLEMHLDTEKEISDSFNTKHINDAINKFFENPADPPGWLTPGSWKTLKDETLVALLYFASGQYDKARDMALKACKTARDKNLDGSLAAFIWAVTSLYDETLTLEKRMTIQNKVLRAVIRDENKGKAQFQPLIYAIYLDRLMYLFHNGKLDKSFLDNLVSIMGDHQDSKTFSSSLTILAARLLIEIKRTQQDILLLDRKRKEVAPDLAQRMMKKRLMAHSDCLEVLEEILPWIEKYNEEIPEESPFRYKDVKILSDNYGANLPTLRRMSESSEPFQTDETSETAELTEMAELAEK